MKNEMTMNLPGTGMGICAAVLITRPHTGGARDAFQERIDGVHPRAPHPA